MMKSRFTDGKNFFGVEEVKMTDQGLTVYYFNETTQQQYNCLLEAFSERFTEITNTHD